MRALVLALLALPAPALADLTISGTYIQINYWEPGVWNNASGGFQVRDAADGSWVDVTFPGNPWQSIGFAFTYNETDYDYYGNYYGTTYEWFVLGESDLSKGTTNEVFHEWTAGPLTLGKTETWEDDGRIVYITFEVTNVASADVSDFRLQHAMDPDQDAPRSYSTYIDSVDLDEDGVSDWVEAEGTLSGWTIAYGACDPDTDEVGGFNWSTSTDATYTDYAGVSADRQISFRHTAGTIAAGETATFGVVVVFDATVDAARSAYLDEAGPFCGWDRDEDGFLAGEDCDDHEERTYPGAPEYCNDVDDDCDGTVDEDAGDAPTWYTDADGDGFGDPKTPVVGCDAPKGAVVEGDDCNDADPEIHPDAWDTPYDGIDQDCTGADWCDVDGDGDDAEVCGGGDCDDVNPSVYNGAPELPDGIDNDCDGVAEDDDTDGDGLPDEDEQALGTNPDNPDTDGDGLPDGDEVGGGKVPADSDGDWVIDALDTDDDGDDIPTSTEIGDYDWTVTGSTPPDTDGDGTPDHLDEDSDGDGTPDADEGTGDTDCDGLANYVDDDDADGTCEDTEAPEDDTAVEEPEESGCGCAQARPSGAGWLLLALGLPFLRRRRG